VASGRRGRRRFGYAAVAAAALWLAAPAAGGVYGDFNGDGFADLAVGSPKEDAAGISDSGAVNVIYGRSTGLAATGDQYWHQNKTGAPGDPAEAGDLFGSALAAGDFDGDGFSDLAIGAPGEGVGGAASAGAVTILYGSFLGLTDERTQAWHQAVPGLTADGAETGDSFGSSLAAANFGKGSADDLAVGAPQEAVGALTGAGAVNILYGSSAGLTATGDQFWHQDSSGILDSAEDSDHFGWSLAVANLGKSSVADLAVGVPDENLGALSNAGAVNVLYGSTNGLTASGDQFWHQDTAGVADGAEAQEGFGWSLASANFGKSSAADLAVGVPFENVGTAGAVGAVNVLYGSSTGLTASGDQVWHQDRTGVAERAEFADRFGWSVAAANFGKSSAADLAVGVRDEDVASIEDAGAVNILYGSSAGLTASGDQLWHQETTGVAGEGAEGGNQFGGTVAGANFGRNAFADLAIGAPNDDAGGANSAGTVNVLYGSAAGLTATRDQFWHRAQPGVAGGGNDIGALFGSALAPRR
jgi:disulfide bond formation protein DsbB